MLREETKQAEYAVFVREHDLRLRQALSSAYGPDLGREAAAEAFAYGWEHWERVAVMDNPIGYLYRVGQTNASRLIRNHPFSEHPAEAASQTKGLDPTHRAIAVAYPLRSNLPARSSSLKDERGRIGRGDGEYSLNPLSRRCARTVSDDRLDLVARSRRRR